MKYLKAAKEFAHSCDDDVPHSSQVSRLSLYLFDELHELHGLGNEARFFLELAGLLHDVGYCESAKSHHKHSLRLIREADGLPFSERERLLIGSIARYHRKALPKKSHDHYMSLDRKDRRTVRYCGAIIRIADSCDISHSSSVQEIEAEIAETGINLVLVMEMEDPWIKQQIDKKKNMFEKVFKKKLSVSFVF
jgi:exopolyphosphatase/guanosine-5'-triphosphate,3'-diphosphate pyrophosphatase